jgi:argininosuccinate lyase
MARAIVSHSKFDTRKISAGLKEGFLDATALAEYLAAKGVAFREAHGIVGSLVACCEKQNKKLAELGLDEFKQHCSLVETDVYENLGAAKVVSKYVTEGAAGPGQAREQVAYWTNELARR